MNSNMLLHAVPLFALLLYALIRLVTGFNGLFGQDSHAYLQHAEALAAFWQGKSAMPGGLVASEFAPGYPAAAAFLRFLGIPTVWALGLLSMVGAGVVLALFMSLLRINMPGARLQSRALYAVLGLALAPTFVKSTLVSMSDAMALALMLAFLFFSVRSIERLRPWDAVAAVFFGVATVGTRYALAPLLAPMLLALTLLWIREKRYSHLALGVLVALLTALPLVLCTSNAAHGPLQHSLIGDWSVWNFFKRTFLDLNGAVTYPLPNIVYVFYPLFHPAFCFMLPGLLLLFKRTDVALSSRRVLLICLVFYLFFLCGFTRQNLRFLMPAYVVLLVLLFPAWDRFFAYGSYFFKKLTFGLLGLALLLQTAGIVWTLRPVLKRHNLERTTAEVLKQHLEPGDVLYGFDLDVAMRTYLPEVQHRNLWIQVYPTFEPGAWVLFNEPRLREQWKGKNPMINWQALEASGRLKAVQEMPEGWTLYRLEF